MIIKYNIKYEDRKPYIIYNPNYLQKAMINGEEIKFEYIQHLTAERDNKAYNMLANIHEIEPIILKEALCNMPDNLERSSEDIISIIVYFIAKNVNTTHSNYHQYLDVFDMCISQNIVSKHHIKKIDELSKADFTLKLLQHSESIKEMKNLYDSKNDIEEIIDNFELDSEHPNDDGYTAMAILLTQSNTPHIKRYQKSSNAERLAKIFCINYIKYRNISEAKKFFEIYNFSTQTKADIFEIAKEIDQNIYQEIFNFDLESIKIKNLIHAIKMNDNASFDKILDTVNLHIISYSELITKSAAQANNKHAIEQLIKKDIDINAVKKALNTAIKLNNIEIINIIDEAFKSYPNNYGNTKNHYEDAFIYAVNHKVEYKVINHLCNLLDNASHHNISESVLNKALRDAVTNKCSKTIELLIKQGANVNISHERYGTLLIDTVKYIHKESYHIVKLLLNAGINTNTQSTQYPYYGTALILALKNFGDNKNVIDVTEVCKLLIKSKTVDVNIANHVGSSPIMIAISQSCDTEIIELLINAGADVNATDNNGKAVLYYLLQENNKFILEEKLQLFLDNGLDMTLANNKLAISDIVQNNPHDVELTTLLKKLDMLTEESNSINIKTHEQHDNHVLQSENHDELEIAEDNNHITNNETNYDNHDELDIAGDHNTPNDE